MSDLDNSNHHVISYLRYHPQSSECNLDANPRVCNALQPVARIIILDSF